ncbi:MAG: RidA family protein [Oscillochloris sp.]|nr:RidA family protein [Oscillochloris sp.]
MRQTYTSGSPWEQQVGYARAVVVGDQIFISSTAATGSDGSVIGPGDMYAQTHCILTKIGQVLQELGASYADVVQSRLYLTDITCWQEAGRAHGEVFGAIKPALTMLHVNAFLDPAMLIEIEITAIRGSAG